MPSFSNWVKRRTYIGVPYDFVVYGKQRGILKIAGFFKGRNTYSFKSQQYKQKTRYFNYEGLIIILRGTL